MDGPNVGHRHPDGWRVAFGLRQRLAFVMFIIALLMMVLQPSIDAYRREKEPIMHPYNLAAYKKVANEIESFVNHAVDPCDDFNSYLCGSFHNRLEHAWERGPLAKLKYDMDVSLRNIVTKPMSLEEEGKLCKSAITQRRYYIYCADASIINHSRDADFLTQIQYILGGFPFMDNVTSNENWLTVTLRAFKSGFFYKFFMGFSTVYDKKQERYLLTLNRIPIQDLQRIWLFFQQDNIQKFLKALKDVWLIDIDNATGLSYDLSKFYEDVLKTYQPVMDTRPNYLPIINYPLLLHLDPDKSHQLDWKSFLTELTGIYFEFTTPIVNRYGDYPKFIQLFTLLNVKNHRLWRMFIVIVLIAEHCEYLSEGMLTVCYPIKVYAELPARLINGTMDADEYLKWRANFCYREAISLFPYIAEREYIVKTVSNQTRRDVQVLTNNIVTAMVNRLHQEKYLNGTVDVHFQTWINNITISVGWDDIVFQTTLFERVYGIHTKAVGQNIMATRRNIFRLQAHEEFKNLPVEYDGKQPEKPEEFKKPIKLSVDAYYETGTNNIVLSAAMLRPPIYGWGVPTYLNYASLGPIIASVLIKMLGEAHMNRRWSRFSDYRAWITKLSNSRSIDSKCVTNTFYNYPRDPLAKRLTPLPPSEIIGNVLADFHGTLVALDAYQTEIEAEEAAKTMDRASQITDITGYGSAHLFWILSSLYQCKDLQYELTGNVNDVYAENSYQYRAIPSFKINGPRMNSANFAKAFECLPSRRMASVKRCDF
uniref:Peptidase M13 N-terminal domain-containing protein n=2 Tax=Dendroctonus ponderosae TaxID=77166 RepID=A0AAR5P972_DENPD